MNVNSPLDNSRSASEANRPHILPFRPKITFAGRHLSPEAAKPPRSERPIGSLKSRALESFKPSLYRNIQSLLSAIITSTNPAEITSSSKYRSLLHQLECIDRTDQEVGIQMVVYECIAPYLSELNASDLITLNKSAFYSQICDGPLKNIHDKFVGALRELIFTKGVALAQDLFPLIGEDYSNLNSPLNYSDLCALHTHLLTPSFKEGAKRLSRVSPDISERLAIFQELVEVEWACRTIQLAIKSQLAQSSLDWTRETKQACAILVHNIKTKLELLRSPYDSAIKYSILKTLRMAQQLNHYSLSNLLEPYFDSEEKYLAIREAFSLLDLNQETASQTNTVITDCRSRVVLWQRTKSRATFVVPEITLGTFINCFFYPLPRLVAYLSHLVADLPQNSSPQDMCLPRMRERIPMITQSRYTSNKCIAPTTASLFTPSMLSHETTANLFYNALPILLPTLVLILLVIIQEITLWRMQNQRANPSRKDS